MLEAHGDDYIANVQSAMKARAHSVQEYLNGSLSLADEAADELEGDDRNRPNRWDVSDTSLGSATAAQ